MIYVMSDLHGDYSKYLKAMNQIDLKDNDTLIVLGDILDRGTQPIKILQDLMTRKNVIPLLGNHEYMALKVLDHYSFQETDNKIRKYGIQSIRGDMLAWMLNGGKTTLEELWQIDDDERNNIIDYIRSFKLFIQLECNSKQYILVHGGIPDFDERKSLSEYSVKELTCERTNYDMIYYSDKILITGHTPTRKIDPVNGDKIIKKNNHIALDCGCGLGGALGVICLDDGKEYYF